MTDVGLYTNVDTRHAYRYALPYRSDNNDDHDSSSASSSTMGNNGEGIANTRIVSRYGETGNIRLIAVPDGVSLDANVAMMTNRDRRTRRVFAYSDEPLRAEELETLRHSLRDKYASYPIARPTRAVAVLDGVYPRNNFYTNLYTGDGVLSSASRFVEYRYFADRHRAANIAFEADTGRVFRFALSYKVPIILIMPSNFVQTDNRRGYFLESGNSGLIIRVYSRRLLSSDGRRGGTRGGGGGYDYSERVSVLSSVPSDDRLVAHARTLLARLGMHRVSVTRDSDDDVTQIYAADEHLTLIIGRVDNLALP